MVFDYSTFGFNCMIWEVPTNKKSHFQLPKIQYNSFEHFLWIKIIVKANCLKNHICSLIQENNSDWFNQG